MGAKGRHGGKGGEGGVSRGDGLRPFLYRQNPADLGRANARQCMPPRRRLTAHEKRIVAARAGWICAACGQMLDETYEVDHVVSLSLGGEDSIDNCQPLHAACHRRKTLRDEIARLELRRRARTSRMPRPPLACTRCGRVVSPYFAHLCDGS